MLLTGNGWAEDAVQSMNLASEDSHVWHGTTVISQYAAASTIAKEIRRDMENACDCGTQVEGPAFAWSNYGKPEGEL